MFTDPTLSFTGLATFERNLANLDPWIERFVPPGRRSCELKKIELLDARGMFSVAMVVRQLGCPSRLTQGYSPWAIRSREGRLSCSALSGG